MISRKNSEERYKSKENMNMTLDHNKIIANLLKSSKSMNSLKDGIHA
jgi:hypothetical protein